MASIQLKHFFIHAGGDAAAEDALNSFLRGHQVLEIRQEFVADGANSTWFIAVRYAEGGTGAGGSAGRRGKIDYKEVLEPEAFARFAEMRTRRKAMADEEALPPFAVFTDEELAGIARLADPSPAALLTVKGIGEKKVERFGKRILGLNTEQDNETGNRTV
ncbi:MAG: hypothetical protein COZ06_37115 [Armatimonadetes bacterium CG_4_10_14_3_um_filter_66_18]|nr:MAG: hypothetical protein COZ06_37115 [Armatimonadetes bacterium CG_4_10_14_3_um_filter_66_18]PJB60209.1 MAG: hypothetical protein CO096_35120 [Armatimonadetes bacterium CG_4_9_14_3_um_filter_66_14]